MESKVCSKCTIKKSSLEFDKYRKQCKACIKEKRRNYEKNNKEERRTKHNIWRAKNKDKIYTRTRKFLLEKNYGITLEQYEELLLIQNGLCAICGESEIGMFKGRIRPLAVDHNHTTGEIRQLLCSLCNAGLGHFKDNKILVKKALEYLEFHEK